MIRAWLPRRLSAGVSALAAMTLTVGAASALAQDPRTEPRSLTVIGGDANANRCAAQVMASDITDETIEICSRALNYRRISRDAQVQVLVNRGVTHLRRQENEAAVADFDAVLAIDRRNAEAHLNRGAALLQLRQHGPAIAAITEALSLGVREPHKAYLNRGIAREALGDLRGAYEDYDTALQIQPDWGPASAELARFARGRREHLANALGEAAATP